MCECREGSEMSDNEKKQVDNTRVWEREQVTSVASDTDVAGRDEISSAASDLGAASDLTDHHHMDDEHLFSEDRVFSEEEMRRYFQEADEEEEPARTPWITSKTFRKWVVAVVGLVMIAQVFAWWPQLFPLDAIKFLQVSSQLSRSDDIRTYKSSVVVIRTEDSKGTGFIVSGDGLIVTNRHVIEGKSRLMVNVPDQDKRYLAQVVGVSDEVDLALVKIDGEQLPVLSLAGQASDDREQDIYLIGNPLFFTGIANRGEVIGYSSSVPQIMLIQAPVYKGNSGSPVIDQNGEVIGVVYATSNMTIDGSRKKVGLAVPVNEVHELIRQVQGSESLD